MKTENIFDNWNNCTNYQYSIDSRQNIVFNSMFCLESFRVINSIVRYLS